MCGPADGVIGVNRESIIRKFTLGLPIQHEPAKGKSQINAVLVTFDDDQKKAVEIIRINEVNKA
jgi:calcineurin-like phosphoesterase